MDLAGGSQPDISEPLLAYLRVLLGDSELAYSAAPSSLAGGFETLKYRFELARAPQGWSGSLVLRIFSAANLPQRAVRETAVQNSLADQGYPAPRVFHAGTDAGVLGGSFVIMQHMPGRALLEEGPVRAPAVLGTAHAELHRLDPDPLIDSLRSRGVEVDRFRYGARLEWLYGKRVAHPRLAEALQWLVDNRPPEPARLCVCHGDFHPLNILVQDGEITAVLDWSGFALADPVMDVAFTYVIYSIAAREVFPIESIDAMWASYLDAYNRARPLDAQQLGYYQTLRCVMALIEGAEGQDVWASPTAVARLTDSIRLQTGISIG